VVDGEHTICRSIRSVPLSVAYFQHRRVPVLIVDPQPPAWMRTE
jgi:hypothetical protein